MDKEVEEGLWTLFRSGFNVFDYSGSIKEAEELGCPKTAEWMRQNGKPYFDWIFWAIKKNAGIVDGEFEPSPIKEQPEARGRSEAHPETRSGGVEETEEYRAAVDEARKELEKVGES